MYVFMYIHACISMYKNDKKVQKYIKFLFKSNVKKAFNNSVIIAYTYTYMIGIIFYVYKRTYIYRILKYNK